MNFLRNFAYKRFRKYPRIKYTDMMFTTGRLLEDTTTLDILLTKILSAYFPHKRCTVDHTFVAFSRNLSTGTSLQMRRIPND